MSFRNLLFIQQMRSYILFLVQNENSIKPKVLEAQNSAYHNMNLQDVKITANKDKEKLGRYVVGL